MPTDYTKEMKLIYYTETKDIEIISGNGLNDEKYHIYFKSKYELLDLLKSNEKLFNELKELM